MQPSNDPALAALRARLSNTETLLRLEIHKRTMLEKRLGGTRSAVTRLQRALARQQAKDAEPKAEPGGEHAKQ
jgi:hypothetical protein